MMDVSTIYIFRQAVRALMLTACIALVGCGGGGNFASFPGFAEHFEAFPPRSRLPTVQERQLLERFKPRIFLAEDQPASIDFYADYIAQGKLFVDGELVSSKVGQLLLNQVKNDPNAKFVYTGVATAGITSTVLAKVEYDTMQHRGESWDLTFLCYNLVFPTSGLLAELPLPAKFGLGVVADLDDWHQLDHYVGVTVVLHMQQPVAYFLQQHNYQSTYLVNERLDWPSDDRVTADVALRSNELYPHSAERRLHPGVSFVTEESMAFVKTGQDKPLMAGWDVTHGQREQPYQLGFLPPDDAFYQFKGRLGKTRLLPGRDGPPGADYVQLPGLMHWSHRLVTGFRPHSVAREIEKLKALFDAKSFRVKSAGIEAYTQDFVDAWQNFP